jgi:hypothetical protein
MNGNGYSNNDSACASSTIVGASVVRPILVAFVFEAQSRIFQISNLKIVSQILFVCFYTHNNNSQYACCYCSYRIQLSLSPYFLQERDSILVCCVLLLRCPVFDLCWFSQGFLLLNIE